MWENKTADPATQADYFLIFVEEVNGNDRKYKVMSSGNRALELEGLNMFKEYNVSFIAVDMQGSPCRITGIMQRTDESGKFKLIQVNSR